jgi:hypothetical protein
VEEFPTRWAADREAGHRDDGDEEDEEKEHATRFLLNLINATVYSSGENYERALRDFFTQVEALGLLIGATRIDDVSGFLRRAYRPF